MAEEIVTILKVGTEEAIKSIGDLRDNVKQLKANLNDLEIGSEEYNETLEELRVNETALRNAMQSSGATMDDIVRSANGVGKSYNSLVKQMSDLKREIRNVDISTKEGQETFAQMSKKINDINDELKNLDAQQGVYTRNVGNYKNAFMSAFNAMGGGMKGVIAGGKALGASLKALSANPIMLAVTLLAQLFAKLKKAFEGNEEASNALKVAFGAIGGIMKPVQRLFDELVNGVAKLATGFTNLMKKLGLYSKEQLKIQDLTKAEVALVERQREIQRQNADDALAISELRAKSAEKDKYTAAERLAFLEQASEKERQISERNLEIAKEQYRILEEKSKLAANSAEENQALADAYVAMREAETSYHNKQRELNSQMAEARKQMAAEAKKNGEAEIKVEEEVEKVQEETFEERMKREAQERKTAIKVIEEKLKVVEKGSEEELRLQQELLDKKHENEMIELASQEGTEELRLAKQETYQQQRLKLQQDYLDEQLKAEEEAEKARVEAEEKARKEREDADKAEVENRKKLIEQNISIYQGYSKGLSSIMGSIADALEANEESAQKNAEAIKSLRIATAIIDTISGAITAYMSAMNLPTPVNMIMGAVNAAAVIATGMANVAKLRSASTKNASGGANATFTAPAVVNAPQIEPTWTNVRTMTSASEEERLNAMASSQKVYILNSDLEAAENSRRVQVAEASF